MVAKIAMIWMLAVSFAVALLVDSLARAWGFLWAIGAGLGPVLIARWFWWRINAWSELAAMATSLTVGAITFALGWRTHHAILLVVPVSLAVTLAATYLTAPVARERLVDFIQLVRPGGLWGPVADAIEPSSGLLGRPALLDVVAGLMLVYGLTFGMGDCVLGRPGRGIAFLAVAAVGAIRIYRRYGRQAAEITSR